MPASSGHETASLEENMAEMDDKELFSSAMTDEPTPETTEQPVAQPEATPQQDGRPRDEHGRFARTEPEPTPEPQQPTAQQPDQARDEGHVPPWRLREIREERDAINQRYLETQRQLEMLQRQMPKPEPQPVPDPYENPEGFARYHAQQMTSPVEQRQQALEARLQRQVELNSRYFAERDHGPEAVRSAYVWLDQGIKAGDPSVAHVYNQAMQTEHPFESIVSAHKELSLMQQIKAAGGPDKYREQLLAASQQQSRPQPGQPQGSVTRLPPSLRNTPSARSGNDDDSTDTSDAAMFRHAMR
jgi:hypothetical protein